MASPTPTKNHHIDMPRAIQTAPNKAKFRSELSACVLMDCEVVLNRGVTVACQGERKHAAGLTGDGDGWW